MTSALNAERPTDDETVARRFLGQVWRLAGAQENLAAAADARGRLFHQEMQSPVVLSILSSFVEKLTCTTRTAVVFVVFPLKGNDKTTTVSTFC
jgi:hypothetical protein